MFNRSVNKAVLVGNLGKDPETRFTQGGSAVCNFSIATSESWKNKQTGDYENKSEWHNIVVFGKFAELVAKYAKKGSKIYVEGKLQTRKWQGSDGVDKYTTEIVASDIQLLDKDNGASVKPPEQSYAPQQPAQQPQPAMAPQAAPQARQPQQPQQPQGYGGAQKAPATQAPQQQAAPQMAPQAGQGVNDPSMDFDDEIPFAPMHLLQCGILA